jgi:hypothetical protein
MGRHCARKPCAHCGFEYTDLRHVLRRSQLIYYVECCSAHCRARGPERETREAANEAWNRRAPLAGRGKNVLQLVPKVGEDR